MISFKAILYDGQSTDSQEVEIQSTNLNEIELIIGESRKLIPLSDCTMEAPLGKTRRVILLPDQARLETDYLDAFDELYHETHKGIGLNLVHIMERKWKWVFSSIAGMAVFTFSFVVWGIPLIALFLAYYFPSAWNEALENQVMEALDNKLMNVTYLKTSEQKERREWFDEMVKDFPSEFTYKLEFRSSDTIGANAFALPNGTIIATDDFIYLTESREEFEAVMAHEIGHVIHRHSIQMVLRNSGLFMFIAVIVGDFATASSLAVGIPTLLLENSYSRSFEQDADEVSGNWLLEKYQTTEAMESILLKLESTDENLSIPEILSSHPETNKRVEKLRKLALEFDDP